MSRFGKKPMHFFGTIGLLMFFVGGGMTLWIILQKAWMLYGAGTKTVTLIAHQPQFFLALTLVIIGVQLFLAGFLGELISRSAPDRNNYHVSEKLNF